YCPKLKLYVYVSYLTPKTLLGLLAQPDCEQVAVFIGLAKWGRRNHYLLFRRVGTGKAFNQTLQDLNPPARICKAGTTKCRKSEAQRADAKYTAMKNPEWQTQARRNAPCTALQ
ncbi:MAG: hypothetical protein LBL15_05790, partial [Oscillospiraceae bacterium]|nr:hypothetical protein [Oscillospiraceae bacterium]